MNPFPLSLRDQLYAAFTKEPHPKKIDACPCCVDAAEVVKLISTPLHQITPQQLGGYASSVFLTVGSEPDFRYFLPRILEILATELGWWPQPEVVGRAMANVKWKSYTDAQQRILVAYFDAVFETLLTADEPDGYEIDSWLCGSSHVLPEWELILDRVLSHPEALLKLYEWHSEPLQKRKLGNGFWDDSPKQTVFLEWMLSDRVQKVLMTAWGL